MSVEQNNEIYDGSVLKKKNRKNKNKNTIVMKFLKIRKVYVIPSNYHFIVNVPLNY
jgi:hypothetical protein